MSTDQLTELQHRLLDARIARHCLDATEFESAGIDQAYEIQSQLIQQYCHETASTVSGWKVALSGALAKAKYGLQHPVYGHLCADMQLANDSCIELTQLYQPKLEVELAFILKETISTADSTDAELLEKVGSIRPAIEIADTRWLNWQFNLGQFLADNSAAQFYVLGDEVDVSIHDLDIHSLIEHANVEVTVTTQPEDQPIRNYLWLVRTLLAQHKSLQADEVILTGSIIRPMDLKAGQYQFQVLGRPVSCKVT
ncbi:hypothetical protein QSV37_03435 [Acinetobacter sp. VNK23]|uniref:2-keto-4-pentenoate hydratase n=1 Tax=Acinetobacter thutiue TaxID=2998078 RepID=UPI002578D4C4|nr:fumarylacetoacetate hydrolase family protein [Acinetobacter thutiue]MDM1019368.1 hypothetical protein [Acinetobacter thutiue]